MAWRKWFVRCVVFTIIGACACAAWVYQQWTNPAAVRQQVIAKLQKMYPGAIVAVDGARLRILGGISLREIRLAKRDQPNQEDIAHIPSAILYHDKEKLLDGVLSFRKVELHRPRLRMVRQRDGRWNLEGVAGPLQADQLIPTIIMHQGTLVLEDHHGSTPMPSVEINDLNLTLLNDPLPYVTFEGSASSPQLGALRFTGTWKRTTPPEVVISLQATGLPLQAALLPSMQSLCANNDQLKGMAFNGLADVRVELAFHPATQPAFSYDVRCQVRQGKVQHPLLPMALEDIEAQLRCCNGEVRLEKASARAGSACLRAEGNGWLPCLGENFEGSLQIEHLPLTKELFTNLPEKLRVLYQNFQPVGQATVRLEGARRQGQWTTRGSGAVPRAILQPEDMQVCFVRFPYAVDHVAGTVDMNMLTGLITVDATAQASDGRPVTIKGNWQGSGVQTDASIDIQVTDLPLDDKVITALPPTLQKLARSFHPSGRGDAKAHIRHLPGVAEWANEFHIRFHDGAVLWDDFPYPLRQVTGLLDIYPKHWEFRDFRGQHGGGTVMVRGKSALKATDDKGDKTPTLALHITGQNIPLDDALRSALRPLPSLLKAWDTFAPLGRLNFSASIDRPLVAEERPGNALKDLDVRVDVRGCSIEPTFFPYALEEVTGQFRYFQNRVELTRLQARHGQSLFWLDKGTVDLHPGGGYYADLNAIHAQPLRIDEVFLKALPPKLQDSIRTFQLQAPANVLTRLIISRGAEPGTSPDLFWDGQLHLRDARLQTGLELSEVTGTLACVGRYDGHRLLGLQGNFLLDQATLLKQPLQQVRGNFHVEEKTPDVLLLGVRAPLFGGDLAGQMRLEFHSKLRYEMNLTASQVNLEEFGRHNLGPKAQLKGVAVGRLHLSGQGSTADTLDGNGTLDVPNGRLLNLPLLLDLLKFLGLRWPDRTAFEEAHAAFSIHGRQVRVGRLDLVGSAISLSGQGDFNLDGTALNLDFYPSWARVEQLLPAMIRPFPPALSKHLLKIEMRGKVGGDAGDLRFHKKPIPDIVDPLLSLRERVMGGTQEKKMD